MLNWVPKYLRTSPGDILSNSIAADERRTAVHELVHLLGFENPLTSASCLWSLLRVAGLCLHYCHN